MYLPLVVMILPDVDKDRENPSSTHYIPFRTHPKSLQDHCPRASQRNGICLVLYGSILDLIIGSKLWINRKFFSADTYSYLSHRVMH